MAELSEKILKYLSDRDAVNTLDLATAFSEDHQKIVGALKSIQANGDLVTADQVSEKRLEVTDEGKQMIENGKKLI